MKKRVLSLILALVMLIGVLPVNMLAAEPADELPAQQTVTIETSLDSALADGVYAAAQSPLPVSIRAEADGEAVEHTASINRFCLYLSLNVATCRTYVLRCIINLYIFVAYNKLLVFVLFFY